MSEEKVTKGVIKRRSAVVKLASSEVIAAVKQPVPSGQLESVTQSFNGSPTKIKPKPKPIKIIKAPKIHTRIQEVDAELQEKIDTEMKPIFKEYQIKQNEIQSTDNYATDTTIYTSQTRKSFNKFVSDTYKGFKLINQVKGTIDKDACSKLGGDAIEAFSYQEFIREYMRNASPYRGVLVYHGLGSGKTCSSIAAAEALYGTSNKKIIVMTPFSLRGNFMSEISFCGFRHFNVNNYWVSESLISESGITYLYARSVLSLSESYLKKILDHPTRNVLWIPDFTKPPNFNELNQQDRDDIRAQITNTIENRITFISYNGVTANELKRYACTVDPVTGDRFFDNSVIVIDEIHNLTRLMQGEIMPYITKRKGRSRKIPVEPIEPGKWKPGLCNSELNYKRSYLFYKLLTDARNSKIIGLSGTPIINFPDELGVLANILSGYIECVELTLHSTDKIIINKCKSIADSEPRVDIVRFISRTEKMEVLISVFNEGYEKMENGVHYNPDAQDDIKTVFSRIKAKFISEKISVGPERYVSYSRLPIDDVEFKNEFIDPVNLSIKNKVVLQKRLTGLISYYKGSKEEYMPRVNDNIVTCEMSDYVLSVYTLERGKEIKGEKNKEEKGDKYSAVEQFSKLSNPSSYRFRSRALCNFAFPKGITRPFPNTLDDEVDAEAPITETDILSVDQEELDKQQVVNSEIIPDPDEQVEVEPEPKPEPVIPEPVEPVIPKPVIPEPEPVIQKEIEGGGKPKVAPTSLFEPAPVKEAVPVKEVEKELEAVKEEVKEEVPVPEEKDQLEQLTSLITEPIEKIKSIFEEKEEKEEEDVMLTYQERIKKAMEKLAKNKDTYLKLEGTDNLRQYSTKMDRIIRNILISKGSNLVYSQFKTVEGLGVLALALKANGFLEIEIEGGDWMPKGMRKGDNKIQFSKDTIDSFTNRPKEKRFIFLTGEGIREKRNLILNIFNGNFDKIPENMRNVLDTAGFGERKNKYGEICWVFGITSAGAEGISLKCCRSVHIMEPYWNKVRSDQVKGRAIRICSHQDLEYEDREVDIYTYYTVFSAEQKNMNKIDITIRQTDADETSDEKVYKVGLKKDKINQEILDVMKESAVDCELNAADNDGVQCFEVSGQYDKYIFDPNLEIDKMLTNIELKEVKEPKELSAPKSKEKVQVVELKRGIRENFIISPKRGFEGIIFNIHEMSDNTLKTPIGELAINPATGTFKGSVPVFK